MLYLKDNKFSITFLYLTLCHYECILKNSLKGLFWPFPLNEVFINTFLKVVAQIDWMKRQNLGNLNGVVTNNNNNNLPTTPTQNGGAAVVASELSLESPSSTAVTSLLATKAGVAAALNRRLVLNGSADICFDANGQQQSARKCSSHHNQHQPQSLCNRASSVTCDCAKCVSFSSVSESKWL